MKIGLFKRIFYPSQTGEAFDIIVTEGHWHPLARNEDQGTICITLSKKLKRRRSTIFISYSFRSYLKPSASKDLEYPIVKRPVSCGEGIWRETVVSCITLVYFVTIAFKYV